MHGHGKCDVCLTVESLGGRRKKDYRIFRRGWCVLRRKVTVICSSNFFLLNGSNAIGSAVAIIALIRSKTGRFPVSTVIVEQFRPPIGKVVIGELFPIAPRLAQCISIALRIACRARR